MSILDGSVLDETGLYLATTGAVYTVLGYQKPKGKRPYSELTVCDKVIHALSAVIIADIHVHLFVMLRDTTAEHYKEFVKQVMDDYPTHATYWKALGLRQGAVLPRLVSDAMAAVPNRMGTEYKGHLLVRAYRDEQAQDGSFLSMGGPVGCATCKN